MEIMVRTTTSSLLIEGNIEARVVENESDVVRSALRNSVEEHDGERPAAVVSLYDQRGGQPREGGATGRRLAVRTA